MPGKKALNTLKKKPTHKTPELLQQLRETAISLFTENGMNPDSYHGPEHWDMVGLTAAILLEANGLNPLTGFVFGTIHDCLRENEETDPYHGHRSAAWIKNNKQNLRKLGLSADEIEGLEYAALIHHTDEVPNPGSIEGCCTDADRLDLGRVGIRVNPSFLSSTQAWDLLSGRTNRVDTPTGTLALLYHGSPSISLEEESARIHNSRGWVPSYMSENKNIAGQYGETYKVLLATKPPVDLTDPTSLLKEPIFKKLLEIQKEWRKEGKIWPDSGERLDLLTVLEAGALYQVDPSRNTAEDLAREITGFANTSTIRIYEDSSSHHTNGEPVPTWMTFAKTNVILR